MDASAWQSVVAVLTVLGSLFAVVTSSRAKRAEGLAQQGKLKLEGMQVSVDSLQRSNADLRLDNEQLRKNDAQQRKDLAEERFAREALADELGQMREEIHAYRREWDEERRGYHHKIISLGGTP